jgi:hypothetical protein
MADATQTCRGYKKACSEPLNERNTSGYCKKCYANKQYAEKYSVRAKKKGKPNGHAAAAVVAQGGGRRA